ncbi:MAG: hypothetical protein ACC662_04960, partial [Planctomycetota bacterium]
EGKPWIGKSLGFQVDGKATAFDPTRAKGVAASPLMRADPAKPNVALQDKVGGSVSYSNTGVQVTKV